MEKNNNFLLEIGTEQLPAGYIEPALQEMQRFMEKKLNDIEIEYSKFITYGTPRRLTLFGEKIASKGKNKFLEIIGPPKDKTFDKDDKPTPVAIGFSKKHGVELKDLFIKKTNKGDYICVRKRTPQEDTMRVLIDIVPQVISSLNFPKAMRWVMGSDFQFARPIRWLLCLYGNKVVKFPFLNLKSDKHTYGLYTLSRQKIVISEIHKYREILRNHYVIVDPGEREKIIAKAINQVTKKTGGEVLEDQELLEEINYLLEYPTAVLGAFPVKYLNLPREVLITCMRHHQRYFSVVDKKGNLLPYFVALRNGISEYLRILKEGLEKVLVARLQDAEFYFDQDTKTPLEEKIEKLKKVVYHKQLGSLYDKVERIKKISGFTTERLGFASFRIPIVKRIALLCKSDLVTEMVKEFPELEGVMGKIYATHSGEDDIVAEGIYEHYFPKSFEGKLPKTVETSVVSVADKIDTIVGNFCVGLVPSGSQDPYGLKRQAQGIIKIIINKEWNLSLEELVNLSMRLLPLDLEEGNRKLIKEQAFQFFRQRIENVFEDLGISYDVTSAVLDVGFMDIADSFKRACAIHRFRHFPDFGKLVTLFKRARNIIKQAEKEGFLREDRQESYLNIELLKEPAEKELWRVFNEVVKKQTEDLLDRGNYEGGLKVLLGLQKNINDFFESVMVMTEDEDLRNNRLTLLENIVKLFLRIACFSKIVLGGEPC